MFSAMLLALLCFAGPTQAGGPSPEVLRAAMDTLRAGKPGEPAFDFAAKRLPAMIRSRSATFVSGGAYLAGLHDRRECAAALIEALKEENASPSDATDTPKALILDAMVRMELKVPIDVLLARPSERFGAPHYLLLVRHGERGRDGLAQMLAQGWTKTEAHWAAACALTQARDPRIGAALLSGWDWEIDLVVHDPGIGGRMMEGGGGTWRVSHVQWPPRVQYRLTLPARDAPLQPIEFARLEFGEKGPVEQSMSQTARGEWRARLLGVLLGEEAEPGLIRDSEDLLYEFESQEGLERAFSLHLDDLKTRLARAAEHLVREKLLENPAPALARFHARVRIFDARAPGSEPLQELKSRNDVTIAPTPRSSGSSR